MSTRSLSCKKETAWLKPYLKTYRYFQHVNHTNIFHSLLSISFVLRLQASSSGTTRSHYVTPEYCMRCVIDIQCTWTLRRSWQFSLNFTSLNAPSGISSAEAESLAEQQVHQSGCSEHRWQYLESRRHEYKKGSENCTYAIPGMRTDNTTENVKISTQGHGAVTTNICTETKQWKSKKLSTQITAELIAEVSISKCSNRYLQTTANPAANVPQP